MLIFLSGEPPPHISWRQAKQKGNHLRYTYSHLMTSRKRMSKPISLQLSSRETIVVVCCCNVGDFEKKFKQKR